MNSVVRIHFLVPIYIQISFIEKVTHVFLANNFNSMADLRRISRGKLLFFKFSIRYNGY